MLICLSIGSGLVLAFNYEFMTFILTYRCEQAYTQTSKILETIEVLLTGIKHGKYILYLKICTN